MALGSELRRLADATKRVLEVTLIFRFANRRFATSLVGTILTAVVVAAFMQLGTWQLRRADQKAELQASYRSGQQSTVGLTLRNIERLPRYQQVNVQGRYVSDRQILLDNMPSAIGRPGYRVLTPFDLSLGGRVLVDRGWIPMGDRRNVPEIDVDGGTRELIGRLDRLPQPGLRLHGIDEGTDATWPRVLNFPEHAVIENVLGGDVATRIVLLDASQPDGFERSWQPRVGIGPERHVGYAVQWFAFALTAVTIYLVLGFKRGQDS